MVELFEDDADTLVPLLTMGGIGGGEDVKVSAETTDVFTGKAALRVAPPQRFSPDVHIYLGRTIEDLDRVTAAARTWARKSEELDRARLGWYWTDLASEDAAVRQPAAWALGACGRSSVPYLCERVPVPDAKEAERKIQKAVADLDAPRYAVREKAAQELERFGLTALPHLEAALKPGISPEWRERLEKLIARCKAEDTVLTAEAQRMTLQAIWVLEQADTLDARKRLGELAEANLEAGLSLEAKAALDRVAKRRK